MDWKAALRELAERREQVLLTEAQFEAERDTLLRRREATRPAIPAPATAPRFSTVIGSFIGRYRLLNLLGAGALGSLFRVEHQRGEFASVQGSRALRLTDVTQLRDERFQRRLEEEARLGLRLRHAHLAEHLELLDDGR